MLNRPTLSSPYWHPQVLSVLLLSFSSGLPFLLTLQTLHVWLTELGLSKTTIGLFALLTTPYALKFLWAPLVDHLRIPFLTAALGRRRSWLLLSQVALLVCLVALGSHDPLQNLAWTAWFTFLTTWCAATQDIAFEAYRIETLDGQHLGPGISASVIGFRLGMWVSSGGALYLASYVNWQTVYAVMAGFVIIGLITTLLVTEPALSAIETPLPSALIAPTSYASFLSYYRAHVSRKVKDIIDPALKSFFSRSDLAVILMFILLFKIGDTVLNMMSLPFLLEIGFNKVEIASIAKSFGMAAMIVGGIWGGAILSRFSLSTALMMSLTLQAFSSLMFILQAYLGYDRRMLILSMGIENLTTGLCAAVFIAYLSSLCRLPHTATHYALLTSAGSFARLLFSGLAACLADTMDWMSFYSLVATACVFGLCFIGFYAGHFRRVDEDYALLRHAI